MFGLARFPAGGLCGGEEKFHRSIRLNPNYATAHQWLGMLYYSDGRFTEALASLERAAELDTLFAEFSQIGSLGPPDPYALFGSLRARGAAVPSPLGDGSVLALSYEAVSRVFRDSRTYSSAGYANVVGRVFGHSILEMDPHEHTRYRALVQLAFSRRALETWRDTLVVPYANRLVDAIAPRGRADLTRELAFPFPLAIIAGMLDVPEPDRLRFMRWAIEILSGEAGGEKALAAARALGHFFAPRIEAARGRTGHDLITLLANVELEGEHIPDLEERLRSRFEWGLIADIQSPDLETKIAILRKKAEQNAIALPDDVALFMANSIKSNIRELEGSLIRLGSYASLGGREITVDFAREPLKDVLATGERAITIDEIKREVAVYFGLKVADLASKRRTQNLVYPRQIAMHICLQLTSSSLPVIGKMFGGRDHSTVIHSLKLVDQKMKTSVEVNTTIETITRRIQG